ncbi:hypothetical protein HMPREF0972_00440 [Actinomyces sp. oral taxon 848 str. F0332]|nr:hypothetical protein HMPREF0972_00440 [Actinomyces sp. oral taxon 848 str. F0332]
MVCLTTTHAGNRIKSSDNLQPLIDFQFSHSYFNGRPLPRIQTSN